MEAETNSTIKCIDFFNSVKLLKILTCNKMIAIPATYKRKVLVIHLVQ